MLSTKDMVTTCIAVVLTTLAEESGGEAPEGIMYLAMQTKMPQFRLNEWTLSKRIMFELGSIEKTRGDVLAITALGRKIAAELEALMAKRESDAV